jgi:membrane peptidoglycan carboxypeptidase
MRSVRQMLGVSGWSTGRTLGPMLVRWRKPHDQSGLVHQIVVLLGLSVLTGALVAGLAIPLAGLVGLTAKKTADAMESLPLKLLRQAPPEKSVVLAANGKHIASFFTEDRTNVRSLNEVAPIMQKAMVAIEDERFYDHGALDIKGTIRAFIANQSSTGVVQGGSTITQQYVKMTLVEAAAGDEKKIEAATADTYSRKLYELRLAIGVENQLTKDQILRRYLNIAYFGDGAYGIQSAAHHYFDTTAKKLTLTEAATLAGLVKNPTGYDPTNHPIIGKARRDFVLDRMAELNIISTSDAAAAKATPLGLNVQPLLNGCVNSKAPFFCDYTRRWLLQDRALGATPAAREHLLETGGLTIHTTINMKMQRAADRSVESHIYPTDHAIGGLAFVVPGTGAVRALSQSRPMGDNKKQGETYLDYVVGKKYGDSNGFQAGSTFKVFVLAAAIKQGIPLSTTIDSPPEKDMSYVPYKTCYGTWADKFLVHNSTFSGAMNLYTGTRLSVNTFYVQLEQRTGICMPWRLARKMGIKATVRDEVGSFTLGVTSVSPLEMAEAYATFADRGIHCTSQPVTAIEDRTGKPINVDSPKCERVLPKYVADGVNEVLRGVQEPGGFGYDSGLGLSQESAGKTGTTDSHYAVWFCGYTPNLAGAAMVAGADDNGNWITLDGQSLGGIYTSTTHGSTTAGPIWGDAMHAIEGMLPNATFVGPRDRVINGVPTQVPSVVGFSLDTAKQMLRTAGFYPVEGYLVDSSEPYGTVAYTDPRAYSTVGEGSTVTIYLSDGSPYVPPPSGGGGGGGNGGGGGGNGGGGGGGGGGPPHGPPRGGGHG